MPQWVNFAEVRTRVSLADVIFNYYKITNLKKHGNKLIGACPVHGGDSPRAFHADLEKNIWHCFSQCKRGGNQLDFLSLKEGITIRESALKLQDFFLNVSPTDSRASAQESAPAEKSSDNPSACNSQPEPNSSATNPPLKVNLNLKYNHPHLLQDRGVALETCEHFGVGYCNNGIMRGCIAIPIHDEKRKLVAYAGRRLVIEEIEKYGKYKLPTGFRKELVLYNFHRASEHLEDKGLILVEGFFSVLKLFEAGFKNVVASMGCSLSEHQVKLLMRAKEVVVMFDGNKAGQSGANLARQKLYGKVPVRLVRLPTDMEPDDLSSKALRWLINGMQGLDLKEVSFWVRVENSVNSEAE